ncbi:MAG: transglycosylase SLT domain-containing protein [Candidatus Woesearchaeota archaeon]
MQIKDASQKLFLTGLALAVMTACSPLKFSSNKSVMTNTKNAKDTLEQLIMVPVIKNNYDSILLSTVSKFRPQIKDVPPKILLVGGDTLDLSYERPESIDSTAIAHNIIVRNNALKIFPGSKPYLGLIFQACDDYRTIFPISSETVISLIANESRFDPYAISIAPAFGINQFMRGTATDLGMHVYSKERFPRLAAAEENLAKLNKTYSRTDNVASKLFHNNNFDEAKKYELLADSLFKVRMTVIKEFEKALLAVDKKKLDDDRVNPEIVIPMGVKYLAILARTCKNYYKCSDEQAVSWAIEAYNAGFGSVRDNIRPYPETAAYSRRIQKDKSRLFPQPLITTNH